MSIAAGADSKVVEPSSYQALLSARLYKVLKHPLRRKILIKTGERPWSPTEIAASTGEPVKRVSEHINVLRKHTPPFLELVAERPGPKGGIEHFYRAVERLVIDAEEWAHLPRLIQAAQTITITEELHKEWNDSLSCGAFYSDPHHALMRTALHLDQAGRERIAEMIGEVQKRFSEVELESAARSRQTGERLERTITGLASFPAAPEGKQ